jgi:hypothetical protein
VKCQLVNCKLAICCVGEMLCWWNVMLVKCHVGEMSCWRNVMLANCHVVELSCWRIVSWWNVILVKCQLVNCKLAICFVGEMSCWRIVNWQIVWASFISRLAFGFNFLNTLLLKILFCPHRDLCICTYPWGLFMAINYFPAHRDLFIAFFQARVPPVPAPPPTW